MKKSISKRTNVKQRRSISDIITNLELRRVITELINYVNARKAFPDDLLMRLETLRNKNVGHFIPQKAPNISSEATESLVCHLIEKRMILTQIKGINSIERKGNKKGEDGGADILINGNIKVEVKGTTVKRDITTKSKSNADVFALVWVEAEDWMNYLSPHINVRSIYSPHSIEVEHLLSNGEDKIRLYQAFEKLKNSGLAEELQLNLKDFQNGVLKNSYKHFEFAV